MSLRGDINALGLRFDRELERVRSDFRGEINRLLLWLFPTLVTLLGLTFAAARLS
jgi:hypothetical protein